LGGEGYRHVGPFGLSNGAFDSYMIDLSIIVSQFLLGVEIGVRTSCDSKNGVVGGLSIGLLWKIMNLWRRWWVGF
jgi:hypothetical protein